MKISASDLDVDLLSSALLGKKIDVVVSGSIGAVEAPRFLRALRRLGATVTPWLTRGAAQFTTPMALGWAAGGVEVVTDFSQSAKHIAAGDACIIAPASANFIEKIISGRMDSASSSLVQSYLGQKKPVIVIPNMHDSLAHSPFIEKNLQALKNFATIISPRHEEHKLKFPDPATAALQCAHWINKKKSSIFITLGSTRSYYDEVRYLANYSSGAMGTEICKQAFARGFDVNAIVGPCEMRPDFLENYQTIVTAEEMLEAVRNTPDKNVAAFFVAAVLDYGFAQKNPGKTRSGQKDIQTTWIPTPKVIEAANHWTANKIAFKYEVAAENLEEIALKYIDRYKLLGCFVNLKKDVSEKNHSGILYRKNQKPLELTSKKDIAETLIEISLA